MRHRAASTADLPLLGAWNQELIEDERADTALDLAQLEQRMRSWLADSYHAVIFETDDGPIGYALHRPDESGICLRQFYVARTCRRRGLGREAVRLLLREVFPRGARVSLEVLDRNEAALAFWRAMGFRTHAQTLIAPAER